MTWRYKQSTGALSRDTYPIGVGYSGTGEGRNNPAMQAVRNIGPIPVGTYHIGPAHSDGHLGPCVMNLDPIEDTDTFGRSEFRMHGDNAQHDASHGCIIMGPGVRNAVSISSDRTLVVVP